MALSEQDGRSAKSGVTKPPMDFQTQPHPGKKLGNEADVVSLKPATLSTRSKAIETLRLLVSSRP
jgi:hypothetical protein